MCALCLLAGFASLLTAAVLRVYGFLGWAWPKAFSVVVVVVVAVGTVQYEELRRSKDARSAGTCDSVCMSGLYAKPGSQIHALSLVASTPHSCRL